MNQNMLTFQVDQLEVVLAPDRESMGIAAAQQVAVLLRALASRKETIRVIFACAPSQDSFLKALTDPAVCGVVPWEQLHAFHMDEYVGLPPSSPQSFRRYLRNHLVDRVPLARFCGIRGESVDSAAECLRYERLLQEAPIDLICLGIGENGHLAFNDPPVADFEDPSLVKVVELDGRCRQQQVNDGCFPNLESVPTRALTITLPVFRAAKRLSCVVPGKTKAEAVRAALQHEQSIRWPCTLLRFHPDSSLYLDSESASLLSLESFMEK